MIKGQISVLKNVPRSQHRAVKHIRQANNKHQNQYQPSERGQAVPPHAAVSSVSEWVSAAWPDLSCSHVLSCLRCSCLPIRHSLPPVSKPPPPWCPDLTHSLSCTHTLKGSEGEKRGQKQRRQRACVQVDPPQTVDRQQDDDDEEQGYDQRRGQHMSTLMGGVSYRDDR